MGVQVAEGSIAAFLALPLAMVLIGLVLLARRKGHLGGRGTLIAACAVVFLMIAYGLTGGLLPLG